MSHQDGRGAKSLRRLGSIIPVITPVSNRSATQGKFSRSGSVEGGSHARENLNKIKVESPCGRPQRSHRILQVSALPGFLAWAPVQGRSLTGFQGRSAAIGGWEATSCLRRRLRAPLIR
jgi:hypothetical protein